MMLEYDPNAWPNYDDRRPLAVVEVALFWLVTILFWVGWSAAMIMIGVWLAG
jgi:hypothetical protein